jgi:hypothetical protein
MSTGRLFFAGALLLGLAWFALRSPLPVADPRFIKDDAGTPEAPISVSVFLEPGFLRDTARALIKQCTDALQARGRDGAPAAVEDCAASLKAGGIENLMVNFAGNLVVRGRRGNAPWRIGLRNTRARGANDVIGYLLEDRAEAIATRGEDDPGAATRGLRSISVTAADAPAAAKAADALYAAGPGWPALAQKLGAAQAVAVDAAGQISVTSELAKRVKFLHDPPLNTLP